MNYFNPYFYSVPTNFSAPKVGLFSRLFGGNVTFGTILNGTQRALNFANQAIPLVKQVRPMIGNARTMLKVMNEFKRNDKTNNIIQTTNSIRSNQTTTEKISEIKEENNNNNLNSVSYDSGPTFFI